jgi:hypothetical protein
LQVRATLRIGVAGATGAPRSALACGLADAIGHATGLICGRPASAAPDRSPAGAAVRADNPPIAVIELDDVRALDDKIVVVLLVAPGRADDERQDAAWRCTLIERGGAWAALPASPERALQAALDAVAPQLRALQSPRDGLFTRLAARNASAAARAWRCERCDDPRCEHLSARPAPAGARGRSPSGSRSG